MRCPAQLRLTRTILSTLLMLLTFIAGVAFPAERPRQSYSITAWDTEKGLPSNAILDIRQARDGYLWLASYQGLIRFDGVSFRTLTPDDIPGLTRGSFWSLAEDSSGTLWAATEGDGLVSYKEGRWRVFRTKDGLNSDKLTSLILDERDVLWIGSRKGVNRVEKGRIERLPAPPDGDPSVIDLAHDRDGSLWIGTASDGLLQYRDGKYTRLTRKNGLSDDRITAVFADRQGAIWIGVYGRGVMRMRNGAISHLGESGAAPPQRVNKFFQDATGVMWAAAENGLYRFAGDVPVPITLPGGHAIVRIQALQSDGEGGLWIGSRETGMYRLRQASFNTLTAQDGLPDDLVYAVYGDGAEGLWIATQRGLAHKNANGVTVYNNKTADLGQNVFRDVLRDRNGDVWGATNGGLVRIRDGRQTIFTPKDGLADARCRVLLEDHNGDLWIGMFEGLSRMRDGKFQNFGAADGLPDSYILSIFEDSKHTIWVGTQSEGLFSFRNGKFTPGPSQLLEEPIFRMTESSDGSLWVGTPRGLVLMRDGQTYRFSVREGLPGNAVFQAIDDELGNLWLAGPWGVARIPKNSLEDVAAGRERVLIAKQFGRSDGMVSREASSLSRAYATSDHRIYFSTPSGVAMVNARALASNNLPPRVYVESVVADDVTYDAQSAVTLAPGTRKLEFHFAAPTFVASSQIRYRYKLEGFDYDWVDGGTRRAAYYTNLPPGPYVFRVRARNEDGVWSAAPAASKVRIKAHFWQTLWFMALCGLAVFGIAFLAHKMRVSAVQLELQRENLKAMSLTDELTGLHNRRGLLVLAEQQVRVAERTRQPFDILFVDLDGLKQINDTYGHSEGDRALVDAAGVLRNTFRGSDVVARIGGDEFAALVIESQSDGTPHAAQAVRDRLQSAIDAFNHRASRPYTLSMSAGISCYDPAAGVPLAKVIEAADREMYARKKARP